MRACVVSTKEFTCTRCPRLPCRLSRLPLMRSRACSTRRQLTRRRRRSTPRFCSAGGWLPTCSRSAGRSRSHAIRPRMARRAFAGVEPPKFDDAETTLEQFKERIARTIGFLKTLDGKAIDASSEREITFPLGQNKGQMKGCDYLNHFVLPNFYFLVTAAYAVVRNFGVNVGKRDFIGAIPLKLT